MSRTRHTSQPRKKFEFRDLMRGRSEQLTRSHLVSLAPNKLKLSSLLLVIKMASLILHARPCTSTANATTSATPSHQFTSRQLTQSHSVHHQRQQPAQEYQADPTAGDFLLEWPRLGGKTQVSERVTGSPSTQLDDKQAIELFEIERLHLTQYKNDSQHGRGTDFKPSDGRDATRGQAIDKRPIERADLDQDEPKPPHTALVHVATTKARLDVHPANSTLPMGNKSPRSLHGANIYIDGDRLKFSTTSNQLVSVPYGHLVDAAESKHVEDNSKCALILKRTYILKPSASNQADEWGDKFVFNDVDPDDEAAAAQSKRRVHKTDLCIKHSDVDKALEEARHRTKFERPNDLDSLEVSERSLASVGELNLAAGLLLTKRFDLSPDEIMNALPMIDMSASRHYWTDLCPKHVRPMTCTLSRYRTITAHCNNLKHPSWGASKTPYSRYLPPDYADGLSAPRAARDGEPLPSARLITSIVHQDVNEPSYDYSILFADWGQLLNHDVTRVAVGEAPDCCPQLLKGLCMPIPVPLGDPLYSKFNVKCLKFERSLAATRPKCLLGHRAQINLITSPVDASFLYGSTNQHAARLRTFTGGKLKVLNHFEKHKLKPLLPPKLTEPDKDCVARPKHLFCFDAGDVRVNEQTHLTVLHTIYLREHNRVAKQLAKINIEWDDDKLYHEARHIVAACVQHVMVNEFLPLLLGKHHMNEYKLWPTSEKEGGPGGFWYGYDPAVTISTGTAFAAAAYRYGHSMIEGSIRRLEPKSGALIESQLLRFLFKRPFWLYEPGAVDQLLAGMLLTPAEQTDPYMSEELSGHLFQPPKAKFGHDLAAINIQRGRDQGVPGYNDWREWCGLSRAKSFDDLEPLLMNHTAWQYSKIYKHVDDIDLWSAGISEWKLPGSAVGPTMACIIARQFLNYKRGDRFWYENPGQPSSFTPAQLREIKKITLAKILCTNADDLPRIQPWAMRLPHPIYNAKVACESLPTMNLKFWDSSLMENLD